MMVTGVAAAIFPALRKADTLTAESLIALNRRDKISCELLRRHSER
jgi:hypothetical protein